LQLQVAAGTLRASRNTCIMVPVVKTCTTLPVLVSISANASHTSTPVILSISCRKDAQESANNWR
jgi:hypothetical protein